MKTQKSRPRFSPALPLAGEDNVNIEVMDNSEAPLLRKGAYIDYNRNGVIFSDFDRLLGDHCIICVTNDDVIPRLLKKGINGKYDLINYRGVLTEENVSIKWAVAIDSFTPAKNNSTPSSVTLAQ